MARCHGGGNHATPRPPSLIDRSRPALHGHVDPPDEGYGGTHLKPMHVAMRPSHLIAASVAALAVALPAQASLDARSATMTIRLVSVTTQVGLQRDVAPKGVASKGDVLWQRSQLRNAVAQFGKPKGALVGSDSGTMTLVSTTVADTDGVAVLPGGTIRFGGRQSDSASAGSFAVTGGTGRYAGARGRLEVRSLGDSGTRTSNVYRLTLP